MIKVEFKRPPNYKQIAETFNLVGKNVVFTYGDTVYAPSGKGLSRDLEVHEATHMRQQASLGPDAWWEKYLADPTFRALQELEAYREQYQFACTNYDRISRRKLLRHISKDLSGRMYGDMMKTSEAEALIKTGIGNGKK